jgi:hypothetical protein
LGGASRHRSGLKVHYTTMGFNPFHQRRQSYADYVLVGLAVVVCLALVLWALFG